MFRIFFLRSGFAAATVAGLMALSLPAAEAKTNVGIWIGIPGFNYWNGPGYYRGVYRHRISCSEGRRIVDRRGFNSVRATDCSPRYYHYRARKGGKWYTVRFDSRTARIRFWRR